MYYYDFSYRKGDTFLLFTDKTLLYLRAKESAMRCRNRVDIIMRKYPQTTVHFSLPIEY